MDDVSTSRKPSRPNTRAWTAPLASLRPSAPASVWQMPLDQLRAKNAERRVRAQAHEILHDDGEPGATMPARKESTC